MHLTLDKAELQPIVEAVVEAVLRRRQETDEKLNGQIGMTEKQAADALGVPRHVLRDARLRGQIKAKLVGKSYLYSVDALRKFVEGSD